MGGWTFQNSGRGSCIVGEGLVVTVLAESGDTLGKHRPGSPHLGSTFSVMLTGLPIIFAFVGTKHKNIKKENRTGKKGEASQGGESLKKWVSASCY